MEKGTTSLEELEVCEAYLGVDLYSLAQLH